MTIQIQPQAMKEIHIRHPSDDPVAVIKRWQIMFCEGDHCAAMLLASFEEFHNLKVKCAFEHSCINPPEESFVQNEILSHCYTHKELEKRLFGFYSVEAIVKAVKFLEEKSVLSITRDPDPFYDFDKTLFHPEVCNTWLASYGNF